MQLVRKETRNTSSSATKRARALRQSSSISEEIFWQILRKRNIGFKFRRQHAVGPYFLDFFCRQASLAIELDGEHHQERVVQDANRDAWLASRGIEVIRIPTLDLFEPTGVELARWLVVVERLCAERSAKGPHPQPLSRDEPHGRGGS